MMAICAFVSLIALRTCASCSSEVMRLVAEIVLAGFHGANAERRALVGDRRADHQLDGFVGEDFVLTRGQLHVAEFLAVLGDLRGVAGEEGHQLAAAALDGAGHAIDMSVVEADRREADLVRRRYFRLRGVGLIDGAGTG
jgi:hypothetical protein